ncbi:LacI family DNA-binding transcriptional regulator [Tessaracoccus sp.]
MAGSIHDVASAAGVSPRTVSNVANGFIHVRPQTRERVLRAIEEVGYRPNIAARRLRQGRTGIIGLMVPELSQPYFAELVQMLEVAAERHDYTLMATQTLGSRKREIRLLDEFTTQLVDGVIVSPMAMEAADLETISPTVPLVLIGEQISSTQYTTIGIDNVGATRAATQHLVDCGRQRIAALGAHHLPHYRTSRLRMEGYRAALEDAGIEFRPELVVYTDEFSRKAGREGVARLLAEGTDFDAIMCFTDALAYGGIRALADAGLTVPTDVAITGFDDIEEAEFSVPSLTTIAPDKATIVESALATLLARIAGEDTSHDDVMPDYELIIRESSGRPTD